MIAGLGAPDDAGVYRISDDLAIIQTVDFFTPVTDDPYRFGQIAAANALSDIYAMGGEPKTAMNLVGFPSDGMHISVLRRVIEGGLDKITEAGAVLVGGHTLDDPELKYGLSVTGFVSPDRVLTKKNLRPGWRLILTKPLGTGVINTVVKGGLASKELEKRVASLMAALNRDAAAVMKGHDVSACTDITGFGLLGHLTEMVSGSGLGARIFAEKVPLIPEALEYGRMGMFPAGAFRNRDFYQSMVRVSPAVDPVLRDLLFDPQTSGGLLMCVNPDQADAVADELSQAGMTEARIIGEAIPGPDEMIEVTWE
ncbi:Selenide, water dikinase [Candidatus Desulfarcum epimagneticum]|uniref:Selenide, water dikinase n=1 Tax=uncultured Desulfobacteraceae bacterium TaxID=218296 RepID=A0A484HEC2_9BACT|nr:Selenide, water dikinase [uncultured Desulfobacteraceae bacterium]